MKPVSCLQLKNLTKEVLADIAFLGSFVTQIRVVLYLGALCSGILETLAEAEKAAIAAVACLPSSKSKRLLPLLSSSKRRRKEEQDDMRVKAAMIHKTAIDTSLRRILISLRVHHPTGLS